jgi:4-amino-4-deoxy-L-arabinose transferase-like glycosyltransferase
MSPPPGHNLEEQGLMKKIELNRGTLFGATAILLYLALVRLVAVLLFSGRYGYFRDELYYLACADHLALGYVDHPPLSIGLLAVVRALFGDSLFAIRLLPALAGAVTVFLSGLLARKLGAGKFGQSLTALAVFFSPVLLGQSRYFSMNSLDILFWTIAAYLVLIIVTDDWPRLWPLFGFAVGLGLMNKYSVGFLVIGLVAGFLLTSQRKHLLSPWFWAGAVIAGVLFLPHLVWEIRHGFPSFEFMRNAALYKNVPVSIPEFFLGQSLEVGFAQAVIWIAGLFYFFFHPQGKRHRFLGWMFIVIFAIMIAGRAKAYYLSPVYPVLLAGGAVLLERTSARRGRGWMRASLAGFVLAFGLIAAPMAIPCLPLRTYISYQDLLGMTPSSEERKELGVLPQHYADMFGWEEMVATVAGVYRSLTPEEQEDCVIYVRNYGQAGAIDFFGGKYGLPKASCTHNSYWFWGPPEKEGKALIVFGFSHDVAENLADLSTYFESVEHAATFACEYGMPYENNRPIFVGRGLKVSLEEIWELDRHFE